MTSFAVQQVNQLCQIFNNKGILASITDAIKVVKHKISNINDKQAVEILIQSPETTHFDKLILILYAKEKGFINVIPPNSELQSIYLESRRNLSSAIEEVIRLNLNISMNDLIMDCFAKLLDLNKHASGGGIPILSQGAREDIEQRLNERLQRQKHLEQDIHNDVLEGVARRINQRRDAMNIYARLDEQYERMGRENKQRKEREERRRRQRE